MLKNNRAHANLVMLKFVARKLGDIKEDVVFLGGCTTALFVNDPVSPDIRITLDVDCIVDVLSLKDYYQLEKKLSKLGFKKSIGDEVICRWHYDDVILDVMPTNEKILGFSNRWYKEAIENAIQYKIDPDLFIKVVTAPYFLATKLEAFKSRGKKDYLMSHDFEDIISIVDGRLELLDEITSIDKNLRIYLKNEFSEFLKDDNFISYLPGQLNYGSVTAERTKIVLERIHQIAYD